MSQDRKPWLFLKRVNTWNPLAGVKHLMPAPNVAPRGEQAPSSPSSVVPEKRWV